MRHPTVHSTPPVLHWFRLDLRVEDHAGLTAAIQTGRRVIPVFIWAPDEERPWEPGAAGKWWLHHSLQALAWRLEELGMQLIFRRAGKGGSLAELMRLVQETGADTVQWTRRYEPAVIERDKRIKKTLRAEGVRVESFAGNLLHEPWTIQNKAGKPYQVFTPFWKHCLTLAEPLVPNPCPPKQKKSPSHVDSLRLEELDLLPQIPWDQGLQDMWRPGEARAKERLRCFLDHGWDHYSAGRNHPDQAFTSRLSAHLHFGEITPRQIWHEISARASAAGTGDWKRSQFLAEVGWREFSHHLLYHFPKTPELPLRDEWEGFPTEENTVGLEAWKKGLTGYPIVDAGMRELWTTGWMHNRVRMIVASFLVKDLFLPWQEGAWWFWDTLVDADLAQNTLGWQWSAGCGADAAPYFRIFNPVSQGQKFDAQGVYVRKWIPEIAALPTEYIHAPWEAPAIVLTNADVTLGTTYPYPIVEHDVARKRALALYSKLRKSDS